jgi:hypothetical protein
MALPGDLGDLILRLNPYTNKIIPYSNPQLTTGDMDPYCRTIVPIPAGQDNIDEIEVESDGPYRQEWVFKGEPQRVGMAYRIKYRYPVNDAQGNARYWLEDYLLIGFEGSMGG